MVSKAQHDIRRKRQVLDDAAQHGNVRKTCRHFGTPRSLCYLWRGAHPREGDAGLVNKRPSARSHPTATPPAVVARILHLRRTYQLGPIRIVWSLERDHGIAVCDATVSRTVRRHGRHRLPTRVGRRAVHPHRYEKPVPGQHVQVDVTCLTLQGPAGRRIRRYQYTAIDDATRVRALRISQRHTQQKALAVIDHVVGTCPFRIHAIRTDRGHACQALCQWHVADLGMRHVSSTPRTPQRNGKVERSPRTDQQECYQLLSDQGDLDLEQRLSEWETFYNYDRPHTAFGGKTECERNLVGN